MEFLRCFSTICGFEVVPDFDGHTAIHVEDGVSLRYA